GLPWLSFDADAGLDDHNEPVATRWSENIRVPARASVSWHATLAFANGAPLAGVYELQIAPRFSGMTQRLNLVGSIVRYEVRSISGSAEQAEVGRRALMQASRMQNENELVARQADIIAACDRLLQVYPTSSLAYRIKGNVLKKAGRLPEAVSAFSAALMLLTNESDAL